MIYRISRLSYWQKCSILIRFHFYYNLKANIRKYSTVVKMLLKREVRLYYLYSTKQLITVTWRNYAALVKVDAKEFALIKQVSAAGETWSKGERF